MPSRNCLQTPAMSKSQVIYSQSLTWAKGREMNGLFCVQPIIPAGHSAGAGGQEGEAVWRVKVKIIYDMTFVKKKGKVG